MALEAIMEKAAELAAQGMDAPTIAAKLEISVFWTQMVMGTDAFTLLVRRWRDENQCAEGEDGAAQDGQGDAGEGRDS